MPILIGDVSHFWKSLPTDGTLLPSIGHARCGSLHIRRSKTGHEKVTDLPRFVVRALPRSRGVRLKIDDLVKAVADPWSADEDSAKFCLTDLSRTPTP